MSLYIEVLRGVMHTLLCVCTDVILVSSFRAVLRCRDASVLHVRVDLVMLLTYILSSVRVAGIFMLS